MYDRNFSGYVDFRELFGAVSQLYIYLGIQAMPT